MVFKSGVRGCNFPRYAGEITSPPVLKEQLNDYKNDSINK
jgi:hypothetical protein